MKAALPSQRHIVTITTGGMRSIVASAMAASNSTLALAGVAAAGA